jgi:hypothetical protein
MSLDPQTDYKIRRILVGTTTLLFILGISTYTKAHGADRDLELVVHGFSKHFRELQGDSQSWNECNSGLALRFPLNREGSFALQGGAYKNSFARNSIYVGVDWIPIRRGRLALGAGLGVATGYPIFNGKPIPIGGLLTEWKAYEKLSVRLRVLPPVAPKTTCALSIELGWRFPKIASAGHWIAEHSLPPRKTRNK